ncbi:hypothetical protein GCM10011415_02430 [Salipiger pallidus]|uniref:DUF4325 domain-containing protein n=1 Tax=Salipiger pallidus TaxID=1775170 RepID=A0A8J3EFI3_9RHOB|nr:STAS-like domain-containing protein [Salipiger pallidus]GGG60016.1 hypothetical protein GCM10011415_02430 [Salipiger pallidus]
MSENIMLKLSDFSKFPSGRDDNDGDYNGQKYRDSVLTPAFQTAVREDRIVEISLEGVLNFGSSFLEEAFGGLVRKGIIPKNEIKKRLSLVPKTPYYDRYSASIFEHIGDAKVER